MDSLTIQELYDRLGDILQSGRIDPNQSILIPVNEPGFGPRPAVKVTMVTEGIDWDRGRVFLIPSKGLILDRRSSKILD